MDNCKIIEDLLPSHCDGLTSEETNAFIRSHTASCTRCAELLAKMKAAEPRLPDSGEDFGDTLRRYERLHRRKMRKIALCCAAVILVIALIWVNSFNLALLFGGIDRRDMTVLEEAAVFQTGETTKIILVRESSEEWALAKITKNDILNFWYLAGYEATNGTETPVIVEKWFGDRSSRFYSGDIFELLGNDRSQQERNAVYCGNNAVCMIDLPAGRIPNDLTMRVEQRGSCYCIYVVSYSEEAMESLDLIGLLREQGYIAME